MNPIENNPTNGLKEDATELSEDIEVVGPGSLLSDARVKLGFSQQDVADKLNFRLALVEAIESENFDESLPSAFNRGYLRNYAKLVQISQEDVLASYDLLSDAERQCAELQSFSKGTEKQAEHNLVMWVTYLILTGLIAATVVWWMQTSPLGFSSSNTNDIPVISTSNVKKNVGLSSLPNNASTTTDVLDETNLEISKSDLSASVSNISKVTEPMVDTNNHALNSKIQDIATPSITQVAEAVIQPSANSSEQKPTDVAGILDVDASATLSDVVFTFAGDCWVNIYDATGERIAWGVKKAGYVMSISGQAPFKVTLGRPELVKIDYNDVLVDTSGFPAGNIAKFSLPLKL